MKKIISFVLAAILFISSFPLYTFAAQDDVSENVYGDMYENYQAVMAGWTWSQYLQNDSNFGFVEFSKKVDESPFLRGIINTALSIADGIDMYKLINDGTDALSEDDVEIGFYEDAILSLLMTMEQDVSGSLEQQAKADATMTLKDYMVDGTEAVAGTVTGLFVDSTAVAQSLTILVDGLSGSMDVLSKTIDSLETQEQYASLSQYMRNYGQFERVLNAIQDYSTDENLKQAARNVQNALQQCFEYKMDHFTDYLEDATLPNLSSFFFDDVLKQVLEKENLEITGLSAMCNLSQGIAAFNAGAKLGSFFANSVFGSNDIFLRYFEMRAMAKIRDCLISEVANLEKSVVGAQDYQEMQKIQSYLYCLLYTCSRGEYCMYSMLTKDADMTGTVSNLGRKLIAWIFGKELTDFDEWYASACGLIEDAKQNVDGLNLAIPDMENSVSNEDTDDPVNETPELEELHDNDILTVAGTVQERYYEINSLNKGVVYILKLDEPITRRLYSSNLGYAGEAVEISEIQLNFSYEDDFIRDNFLGQHIQVTGSVMYVQTGHHLTDFVLIVDSDIYIFSADNSLNLDSPAIRSICGNYMAALPQEGHTLRAYCYQSDNQLNLSIAEWANNGMMKLYQTDPCIIEFQDGEIPFTTRDAQGNIYTGTVMFYRESQLYAGLEISLKVDVKGDWNGATREVNALKMIME